MVHDLDEALEACAGTAAAKAICCLVANVGCLGRWRPGVRRACPSFAAAHVG
jgi:hypothetical protein